MIEYTLLNILISELKIYCGPDKFYGRSKFGQYDEVNNRAPSRYYSNFIYKVIWVLFLHGSNFHEECNITKKRENYTKFSRFTVSLKLSGVGHGVQVSLKSVEGTV